MYVKSIRLSSGLGFQSAKTHEEMKSKIMMTSTNDQKQKIVLKM